MQRCRRSRNGAAPWVDVGLRRLLVEAGLDLERDRVNIAPVPGAVGAGVNFGVTAAKALEDRKIDGFWANGMGAAIAESFVAGMNRFCRDIGILEGDAPYASVVATQFAPLWKAP